MEARNIKREINKSSAQTITKTIESKITDRLSPKWVATHKNEDLDYRFKIIHQIRKGVTKADWKEFIQEINSTEKDFEKILPTSISSLQKKDVYNKETSERIYELARLFSFGFDVFDTKEDFKQWLQTPVETLGNKKPFEFLDSSIGFEIVENEITRIKYNVYS